MIREIAPKILEVNRWATPENDISWTVTVLQTSESRHRPGGNYNTSVCWGGGGEGMLKYCSKTTLTLLSK
jgi:hypothetical protein